MLRLDDDLFTEYGAGIDGARLSCTAIKNIKCHDAPNRKRHLIDGRKGRGKRRVITA